MLPCILYFLLFSFHCVHSLTQGLNFSIWFQYVGFWVFRDIKWSCINLLYPKQSLLSFISCLCRYILGKTSLLIIFLQILLPFFTVRSIKVGGSIQMLIFFYVCHSWWFLRAAERPIRWMLGQIVLFWCCFFYIPQTCLFCLEPQFQHNRSHF